MNAEKSYSPTKVIEFFIIGMIVMCAMLATIAFLAVFNVYQHGWSGALPLLAMVVGLTYIGLTSDDRWSIREVPAAQFALSLGAGLLLGVVGIAAKVLLTA